MYAHYRSYLIRDWQPTDRAAAAGVVKTVLAEYGLGWEGTCGGSADQDAVAVETYYWQTGGEFWVVESAGEIVGTAAYCPTERSEGGAELRKMFLLPIARGQGLGRYLLAQIEGAAQQRGIQTLWLETATVLDRAVALYEKSGYLPATGVETARCDRVYYKSLSVSAEP
ncbi:MAG: GNAT family N-acetyltransferase [Cyanobacteria bacterium P01_A01_bin.105]